MHFLIKVFVFASLFIISINNVNAEETTNYETMDYIVKPGDIVQTIAYEHNMTVNDLLKINGLTSHKIERGKLIKVKKKVIQNSDRLVHIVQKGEYLYLIATKYGLTVEQLMEINNLTSKVLYTGQVLYVSYEYKEQPVSDNVLVQNLLKEAHSLIGTPYVWAGTSPDGFDCSGYIQYLFKKQGKMLPRTVEQMWNFGKTVPTLEVGDVLFWETYMPGPSHAGIYIGNRQFIHASSSKGVTISNMDSTYYKERYLGFKRLH